MAYQRSTEMAVRVSTETDTDTPCKDRWYKAQLTRCLRTIYTGRWYRTLTFSYIWRSINNYDFLLLLLLTIQYANGTQQTYFIRSKCESHLINKATYTRHTSVQLTTEKISTATEPWTIHGSQLPTLWAVLTYVLMHASNRLWQLWQRPCPLMPNKNSSLYTASRGRPPYLSIPRYLWLLNSVYNLVCIII